MMIILLIMTIINSSIIVDAFVPITTTTTITHYSGFGYRPINRFLAATVDDNNDNNDAVNNNNGKNLPPQPFGVDSNDKGSPNPFLARMNNARGSVSSSADFYGGEELRDVLALHEDLRQSNNEESDDVKDMNQENEIPSIHDAVIALTSAPITNPTTPTTAVFDNDEKQDNNNIQSDKEIQAKIKNIRAIASDIDGTLLTSKQRYVHH